MNAKTLILSVMCMLFTVHACAGDTETCSLRPNHNTVLASIKIKSYTGSEKFYFRLGDFVAFISAHDFEMQLRSQATSTGLVIDTSLAQDIGKAAGLTGQVDLFKYVLSNPKYLPRLEFVIAQAFDMGLISLLDIRGRPRMDEVLVIKRISYSSPVLKRRIYCAPDEDLILSVTDVIA